MVQAAPGPEPDRNQVVCRLHAVLCDLVPGGVSKHISAALATRVMAQAVPSDAVQATRHELAAEFLADLRRVGGQLRETRKKLAIAVRASGTTLTEVFGVGPVIAATVIGDVRDMAVDLVDQGGPVAITVVVTGLAGHAGVLAQGSVEDRDRLGHRGGQIEEQRALPGLLDRFDAELAAAFGGGVRLGRQQLGVPVRGLAAIVGGTAQRSAVKGFTLAEQQPVGLALEFLAGFEAESPSAGSPPAAGRFSPLSVAWM